MEIGFGTGAIDLGAHRVTIVLDHEDDREFPERRHVEGFVNLPLIGRPIAEIGHADPAIARIFVAKGQAGPKRHLRADNPVPAIEAVLGRKHVHRPALAKRDARRATGQFRHDQFGVDPVGEHMAMIAIAGDDAVLARRQRRLEAHRNRLLPYIEMTEATDEAEAVKLPSALLEPADKKHCLVELQQLAGRRLITFRFRQWR